MFDFKPHIVKFEDGEYAIRKCTLFGWRFRSLYNTWWWDKYNLHQCKTDNLKRLRNTLKYPNDIGTPI